MKLGSEVIYSWQAFNIGLSCLLFGLVWGTFFPSGTLTVNAYMTAVVGLSAGYFAKRVADKAVAGKYNAPPVDPEKGGLG